MKSITRQKGLEEIIRLLGKARKVSLVGCGTCPTMAETGGLRQVEEMARELEERGVTVASRTVIPVACEPLPGEAQKGFRPLLEDAQAVLILSCSLGVRMVSDYTDLPVLPALDTLFIGREAEPGFFVEECAQCGDCLLGDYAGVCPIVHCAKSLFNGPCGGSVAGKCEVDPGLPCGWQLIYDRMKALGRLEELSLIRPYKDWSRSLSGGARRMRIPVPPPEEKSKEK
ncbi:methylenetetrahydrofolate reductase C-terminal domain-containing protein [Candidatus Solincola sp.]|jgi:ferredoxin|nr:methylenetetrahydrofolate reductase C-terminal domain-containing protein [Actinomycetota bacterium]MDI7251992.1 methylenetetrahydrofolate reductase C-terminal domain-containing protein [Actinomycetota bacterium]